MFFVEEFQHLQIQLQDIISATDNFGPNKLIGHGGFGQVYKGELFLPERRVMVAFKRLDRKFGQGNTEFWKEIMMLSKCKHENLVSLIHFCFEGDERILVYEYASRGSLDRHLSDASLTWMKRLKICVGVARGLNYLHDPMETKQRVLHRDIKSSNILLDENWKAKVSDFGLSKLGPANQPQTYLVSNVVGTFGYCDPSYFETGLLSKETDVYSFGVVLFEVMCGRLCCEYRKSELVRLLVPMWKKSFDEKKVEDIICHDLKGQIDVDSLKRFSTIANRCLHRDHRKRPTMAKILKELEVVLKQSLALNETEAESSEMIPARVISRGRTCTKQKADRQMLRTSVRTVTTRVLLDDGYRWRKYGQRDLVNAKSSRSYFRCIHSKVYKCPAKKQVQRHDQEPVTYEITYKGDHTCTMSSMPRSLPPEPTRPPPHLPFGVSEPLTQWLSMDMVGQPRGD